MGVAFSVGAPALAGCALFPHVLCKSCAVRVHLDPTSPPWYPGPEGFTQLAALPRGQRVAAASGPTSRAQCEVRDCGGWICSFIYFKLKIMGKSELSQGLLMSNFVWKKNN